MNMITMNSTKAVKCAHCGADFSKPISLIDFEKKAGRKQHFCSLSCINDYNIALADTIEQELKHFKHVLSLVDENPEKIKTSIDIDVLYLRTIWDNQRGRCVYSNVPLVLPTGITDSDDILYAATIDRINPSVGFIKGNITFISVAMSFMKENISHEKTLKLVKLIKTN